MAIGAPICIGCKHFDQASDGLRCRAFPSDIPDDIVRSRVDHRLPVVGDRGLRFEPLTDEDARYAEETFALPRAVSYFAP